MGGNDAPTIRDITVRVSLGSRVACLAQHAFHHIEKHLNKTPNEYIRWRYESVDDKETLEKEYATHTRMSALSGGQKVKVVLAAAMWNQPHILILDEPTNYLDRDSLGALSGAIEEFGGGVVMITHNNEFCSKLCPETWLLQGGRLDCQGDAAWMENVMKEEIKAMSKQRKAALDRGEDLSDDEDWDGSTYIGT